MEKYYIQMMTDNYIYKYLLKFAQEWANGSLSEEVKKRGFAEFESDLRALLDMTALYSRAVSQDIWDTTIPQCNCTCKPANVTVH